MFVNVEKFQCDMFIVLRLLNKIWFETLSLQC